MHANHIEKTNMLTLDAPKTTEVIGLIMQQTAALHSRKGVQHRPMPYINLINSDDDLRMMEGLMKESFLFIDRLTGTLNKAYSVLLSSDDGNRSFIIKQLGPEQTELIELQLRGLEGALKHFYRDCKEPAKSLLKKRLILIAQSRAAASRLNHLINQMIRPVDVVKTNIDKDGLRALAEHGSKVFSSGQFH